MARTTTRSRRVATAVPLALVSVAWTTHVTGTTTITAAAPTTAAPQARPGVPFGPVAPTTPSTSTGAPTTTGSLDAPASLSTPTRIAASDGRFSTVAARPTSSDIPATALAAYQRAETVINAADPACGLSWQLLAAIGRIESDHGRFGGATLRTDGVSTPSILGPVLDGRHGTATIRDTDAGQYDGDTRYDRAVGPLQFIPSTWSVVGVDADNDGARDPLDIDDAALAAAVYLCSGTDDLTKAPGQRLAVFRYNHSSAYVDQVLSLMGGYLQGGTPAAPATAPPVLAARPRDVGPLVPVAGAG
ncbi:lytic transglycosylase domain-containing protein, partial [Nocardioides plantarum]